jgi:hypothetical protein
MGFPVWSVIHVHLAYRGLDRSRRGLPTTVLPKPVGKEIQT